MKLALGSLQEICWRIARAIVILLILFGLAVAIPTLIAADSLSEWINDK
tara:strand:- start:100 stop:246 length:147 start_codon:yes stop_codon:yes gene_type:complete